MKRQVFYILLNDIEIVECAVKSTKKENLLRESRHFINVNAVYTIIVVRYLHMIIMKA